MLRLSRSVILQKNKTTPTKNHVQNHSSVQELRMHKTVDQTEDRANYGCDDACYDVNTSEVSRVPRIPSYIAFSSHRLHFLFSFLWLKPGNMEKKKNESQCTHKCRWEQEKRDGDRKTWIWRGVHLNYLSSSIDRWKIEGTTKINFWSENRNATNKEGRSGSNRKTER